jgi:hypothetical protein
MTVVTAALARPKSLGTLSRTYHVLKQVAGHTQQQLLWPLQSLFSLPSLLSGLSSNVSTLSRTKTCWSYALKIFSRIYRMLSLLGGLSYYHTFDHPAWQAGLLSRLFRWIEWAAYAFGVLWLSTDKIGSFFVRCGLAYASATPEPGPGNAPRRWHSQSLLRYTILVYWACRHTPSAHRSAPRMSWLSTSLDL